MINMTNEVNMDESYETKGFCADAVNMAKTAKLTKEISAKIKDAVSLEEAMEDAVASYLPMTEKEIIRTDVKKLLEGVNDVYADTDQSADLEWLEQRVNGTMAGLSENARASYLYNILALVPEENLESERKEEIEHIKAQGIVTEEDFDYLIQAVRDGFEGSAGILTRSSVSAMEGVFHILPTDLVKKLGNDGKEKALAYAGACYVMNRCGENPWSADGNIREQEAYMLGVIAAVNTEDDKLLSMYYNGKIKLTVLKERLRTLFFKAITFVTVHTACIAAIALQISAGVLIYAGLLNVFYYALHFGLWVSIAGAAVLSGLAVTRLVTTEDIEDLINKACSLLKRAWETCREKLAAFFCTDTAAAGDFANIENNAVIDAVAVTVNAADEAKEEKSEISETDIGAEADNDNVDDDSFLKLYGQCTTAEADNDNDDNIF